MPTPPEHFLTRNITILRLLDWLHYLDTMVVYSIDLFSAGRAFCRAADDPHTFFSDAMENRQVPSNAGGLGTVTPHMFDLEYALYCVDNGDSTYTDLLGANLKGDYSFGFWHRLRLWLVVQLSELCLYHHENEVTSYSAPPLYGSAADHHAPPVLTIATGWDVTTETTHDGVVDLLVEIKEDIGKMLDLAYGVYLKYLDDDYTDAQVDDVALEVLWTPDNPGNDVSAGTTGLAHSLRMDAINALLDAGGVVKSV